MYNFNIMECHFPYHNGSFKDIMPNLRKLVNFPSYIRNTAVENHNSILKEFKEKQFYRPKGRPPYSAEMIRCALHLRYTSLQTYKLVIEKFPMPSISWLNKIHQGSVDSLKGLNFYVKREEYQVIVS